MGGKQGDFLALWFIAMGCISIIAGIVVKVMATKKNTVDEHKFSWKIISYLEPTK